MMKHVSLARGLKEKNRLAGKLMELRASIRANNSRGDDSPRDIDVLATFEEMQKIQQRLLDVKAELAHANQGIVDQIIALEELKSEIAWLKDLDTTSRTIKDYHGGVEIVSMIKSIITGPMKLKMIDELQTKANKIQDVLDDYNASHSISIEIDD